MVFFKNSTNAATLLKDLKHVDPLYAWSCSLSQLHEGILDRVGQNTQS